MIKCTVDPTDKTLLICKDDDSGTDLNKALSSIPNPETIITIAIDLNSPITFDADLSPFTSLLEIDLYGQVTEFNPTSWLNTPIIVAFFTNSSKLAQPTTSIDTMCPPDGYTPGKTCENILFYISDTTGWKQFYTDNTSSGVAAAAKQIAQDTTVLSNIAALQKKLSTLAAGSAKAYALKTLVEIFSDFYTLLSDYSTPGQKTFSNPIFTCIFGASPVSSFLDPNKDLTTLYKNHIDRLNASIAPILNQWKPTQDKQYFSSKNCAGITDTTLQSIWNFQDSINTIFGPINDLFSSS